MPKPQLDVDALAKCGILSRKYCNDSASTKHGPGCRKCADTSRTSTSSTAMPPSIDFTGNSTSARRIDHGFFWRSLAIDAGSIMSLSLSKRRIKHNGACAFSPSDSSGRRWTRKNCACVAKSKRMVSVCASEWRCDSMEIVLKLVEALKVARDDSCQRFSMLTLRLCRLFAKDKRRGKKAHRQMMMKASGRESHAVRCSTLGGTHVACGV